MSPCKPSDVSPEAKPDQVGLVVQVGVEVFAEPLQKQGHLLPHQSGIYCGSDVIWIRSPGAPVDAHDVAILLAKNQILRINFLWVFFDEVTPISLV